MSPSVRVSLLAPLLFTLCVLVLRKRWHEWVTGNEAYVWYGTLRMLEGDVPLRDFRSYEPGRYLWCAPFLLAVRRGVLGIRIASLVFFALSLGYSLVLLSSLGLGPLPLVTLALASALTIPEPYKLYEQGFAWVWLAVGAATLASPSPMHGFALGLVVGLAGSFGLNLGLYCSGASVVLLAWLKGLGHLETDMLAPLGLGLVIGATPLILYSLFAPGFFAALLERRVIALARRGTTNLPLPIPFPWKVRWAAPEPIRAKVRQWLVGVTFLILPAVPGLALLLLLGSKHTLTTSTNPLLIAASCLGLFAWHPAYSRANVLHLFQSHVPAMVVGVLVIDRCGPVEAPLFIGLLTVALRLCLRRCLPRSIGKPAEGVECAGWRLDGDEVEVQIFQAVREQLDMVSATASGWLVALPGTLWLLPMLACRSPVYDTFCVYSATQEEQARMIGEIESSSVELAFIDLSAGDGVPERSFCHSHPQVLDWLDRHFITIDSGLPNTFRLLRRKVEMPIDTIA